MPYIFDDSLDMSERPDPLSAIQGKGPESATSQPKGRYVFSDEQPPQNPSAYDNYVQPFIDTFNHGVSDLKDFATMNYSNEHPMLDELHKKRQNKTADRHDYERAFMEGFANNPGGKFLGALGGIIPEANVVTTVLGNWVNPWLVEKTGVDPTELQMAEMLLPVGMAAKAKGKQIPSVKAAGKTLDIASYPIRHPIDFTGGIAEATIGIGKKVVQPVVKGIIEHDNPITGEPGLKTALASDTSIEGQRLANKFGVNMTAGELTGNPTARGMEDALANSGRWGGKFAEANQAKTNAIIKRFNETLAKIYPEGTSRADVGDRLSSAYNDTLTNLIKTRNEQAKIDFGTALQGATNSNILANNLFRELQAIKSEGDAKLLTRSKSYGALLARKILGRTSTKTKSGNIQADTISLTDLANGLSDFSAEAARPGSILDNAQTAAERRVYSRLYSALQKDLDAEISNPKGDPKRAAQLMLARDNFRNASNQIGDLSKTAIGRMVGGVEMDSQGRMILSPEKVADKVSNMEPTEIVSTLKFLDKHHPDVAQMVRRFTLESALKKATQGIGLRGEGTTKPFSKAEFVKSLPDRETLNALLKNNPEYATDVADMAAFLNRMIDYGAERKGSHTAQRQDFMSRIADYSKGALYRSIISDSLANELMNPLPPKQPGLLTPRQ